MRVAMCGLLPVASCRQLLAPTTDLNATHMHSVTVTLHQHVIYVPSTLHDCTCHACLHDRFMHSPAHHSDHTACGNALEQCLHPQASVTLEHQMALVRTHMSLAAELGRPVSMHCVRAHGPLQVCGCALIYIGLGH